MSRPYVTLYIDKQKVEFTTPPEIHLTFSHEDLHNPTVIKNSFSKTITVDGTPNNNRIFGCFGDMTRIVNYSDGSYSGAFFNPSRKVSFVLMRNSEPVEKGYVKLDRVVKTGKRLSYDITLYGGLGQFLYSLSYKGDGTSMKLSDLEYPYDLNIEVNKDTVFEAWQHINGIGNYTGSTYGIYDFINFAPCYNGIPENFTADKVAIDVQSFENADDFDLSNQFIKEKDGYTTVDGWVMGELVKEYDEWQMKDLRSYLQRPVIRMKSIIEACCNPENNGGYEVDLDDTFFNSSNPYYEDAWMTLPLITESEDVVNTDIVSTVVGDTINIPEVEEGTNFSLGIDFTLEADSSSNADELYTGIYVKYQGNVKPAAQFNRARYLQLVVYDASGNIIGGSSVKSFYSNIVDTVDFDYSPEYDSSIEKVVDKYVRVSDGVYKFGNKSYQLKADNIKYQNGMYAKLIVKDSIINRTSMDESKEMLFTSNIAVDSVFSFGIIGSSVDVFRGMSWLMTKDKLLNSEKSPADYFLSYLKMFNLHIWGDDVENRVYIRQRKNYFTDERYSLEELIDRGDETIITPLTFDNKWYDFISPYEEDSLLYKDYQKLYGIPYGIQKVDTNYNFDNSSKSLFENNIYKGVVMNRAKSKYYIDIHNTITEDIQYPPFMLDGCQTFLFNSEGDTTEGSYITPKTTENSVNWWEDKYYDKFPKPDFRDKDGKGVDGANVLLFYNGKVEMKAEDGSFLNFCLTDDIPEFQILNDGEPCWIWSYDYSTAKSAIDYFPCFSRYRTNTNGFITHSFDFGTPKAIYIPDYKIDSSSSIYEQYWASYIKDRYDVNTRIVECRCRLKERVLGDWLRRFYYFDGCWWVMNTITDYDVTYNGTTKCELIKINDIANYLK